MYRYGHIGISLLILSIISFIFGLDLKDPNILIPFAVTVGLSSLPDIDQRFEIPHRGFTHSLLFSLIIGIIGYALFGIIGFLVGFGAIFLHIIGDIMTIQEVEFLWPFRRGNISLELFPADNPIANYGFLILGGIAFFLAY